MSGSYTSFPPQVTQLHAVDSFTFTIVLQCCCVINPWEIYVADVDPPTARRQLCGGSKPAVERMLEFGRELYNMSLHLRQEQGKSENNKKMLQVHRFNYCKFFTNFFYAELFKIEYCLLLLYSISFMCRKLHLTLSKIGRMNIFLELQIPKCLYPKILVFLSSVLHLLCVEWVE